MKKILLITLITLIATWLQAQESELLSLNETKVEIGRDEAPVYNGPTGCAHPIDLQAFDNLLVSIKNQPFEKDKLSMAKQFADSQCLSSKQVKQIMLHFSFEEHRLDFAHYAYSSTYDLNNYQQVHKAFKFSSSANKLKTLLNP